MTKLTTIICCKCKTVFAMDEIINRVALERREAMSFFCPNGHSQSYITGETETDRLRRERDSLKQQQARLIEERNEAVKASDAAKKSERALKKRVKNGTCPCCQRTFLNMQEHMTKMHPEFVGPKPKIVPIPN